jgi:hypothetical protein
VSPFCLSFHHRQLLLHVVGSFGLFVKDLVTRRVLGRYDSTSPLYILPRPPLPCMLLCMPWLPPHPPPPSIIALVTRAPMFSLSCRVARSSLALGAEMIPCIMSASLVGTSGYPFLAPLLRSFDPLTSYTVTSGPPLYYSWTFPLHQKSDTFPTLSHFFAFMST